jgi:hypothetical protein
MQFFGCKFCTQEDCDRENFDSFLYATITVFQIFTQEDWNYILYSAMSKTTPWAALYFISLMVFGNYILFNLLLAIIVDGFSQIESDDEKKERLANEQKQKDLETAQNELENEKKVEESVRRGSLYDNIELKKRMEQETIPKEEEKKVEEEVKDHSSVEEKALNEEDTCCCYKCCPCREGYSLCILSQKNKFRQFLKKMVSNSKFDSVILAVITLNCITLSLERPSIVDGSFERIFLNISNHVFTAIFFVEMCLKVLAFGFCSANDSYIRSIWNKIDFFLVVCSVIEISVKLTTGNDQKVMGLFRSLRLVRALKPLRVINRCAGLKIMVQALVSSLLTIGKIVVICSIIFLVFAILGIQLFKGTFYSCQRKKSDFMEHQMNSARNGFNSFDNNTFKIHNKADCLSIKGNRWTNAIYNFDNLGQALITLFILSSKDGWLQIMYHGMDANGVDMEPIENNNKWMILYFILFIIIIGFFVLNMFVGVIIDNFNKSNVDKDGSKARAMKEKKAKRKEIGKISKLLSHLTFS